MPDVTPSDRRPIGFWLKLVDRLIDDRLDTTLAEYGLTRRHWQILNVARREPVTIADIDDRLRPFLDAGTGSVAPVVADLVSDGWLVDDGHIRLTTEAAGRFDELLAAVSADRRTVADGIDPGDFQTTMAVLERMARNLGWRPDEAG
jgi:hypothetical protein